MTTDGGALGSHEPKGVVELRECRYGPMLAFDHDQVITRSLQLYGEWSEHEISVLYRYVGNNTVVLDVGANIGTHSLAFAKQHPSCMVWGFEPRPLVNSLAWANCARNGAHNVTIFPMGCGDVEAQLRLCPPLANETNVGAFSLRQSLLDSKALTQQDAKNASVRIDVRVAPLDSMDFPFRVSLLKIDVEGLEQEVLTGAQIMLARDQPAVFFESLSSLDLPPSIAILRRLKYSMYWLETHQFNHDNFLKERTNIWGRTEIGILALPKDTPPPHNLRAVPDVPDTLPFEQDARAGFYVAREESVA